MIWNRTSWCEKDFHC